MTADVDRFELPRLRAIVRHSIPRVVECTLIPVGLFYVFLWTVGVWGGILAASAWSYTALGRRLVTRQRIPGLLYLATLGATARTSLALASHSAFVYFLQPSLITAAVGTAFLLSVPTGRPLAQSLALDFVPLPRSFTEGPAFRPTMARITLIWAIVNLVQGGGAILLLLTQPVATFVAAKTALCWLMTGLGAGVTVLVFKRLRLEPRPPVPAAIALPTAFPVAVALPVPAPA